MSEQRKSFTTETLQRFWNHICALATRLIHISDTEPVDDFTELWFDTSDQIAGTESCIMRADAIKQANLTIPADLWSYETIATDTNNKVFSGMYCYKMFLAGVSENTAIINFTVDAASQQYYSSPINWETVSNAIYFYTEHQPKGTINGYIITADVNGSGSLASGEPFDITTLDLNTLGQSITSRDSLLFNGKTIPELTREIVNDLQKHSRIEYQIAHLKIDNSTPDVWTDNGNGTYSYGIAAVGFGTGLMDDQNQTFDVTTNDVLLVDFDYNHEDFQTSDDIQKALANYSLISDFSITNNISGYNCFITVLDKIPSTPLYFKLRKAKWVYNE